MARRPPPRAPSTGLPPTFVAIAVILVGAVGVLFVVSQMRPPPEEPAPAEVVDPFEGLPEEEPPGGWSKPAGGGAPRADAAEPFGDLSSVKEEQLWKDARELGDAGMDLSKEAADAKTAGDQAAFKAKGAAAKEKLEKALDITRDWENELVAAHGANHPEVKSIQRTRNIWRNQLVALKKTVGF